MYAKLSKACGSSFWNVPFDGECAARLQDVRVGRVVWLVGWLVGWLAGRLAGQDSKGRGAEQLQTHYHPIIQVDRPTP
jgi:hypothetical protein